MTSIRGFSELYRQGAVGDDVALARVMRRIEDESIRMGLLVDDLLLLARLDQQRPLDTEPVDLVPIVTDAVLDARAVATGHEVRLRIDTDLDSAVVVGDALRLRQVVGTWSAMPFSTRLRRRWSWSASRHDRTGSSSWRS